MIIEQPVAVQIAVAGFSLPRPEPMPCGLCVELLFLDEDRRVCFEAPMAQHDALMI